MIDNKTYTVEVVEENNEFMLVFPTNVLKEMGWNEGDLIIWDFDEKTEHLVVRKARPGEEE